MTRLNHMDADLHHEDGTHKSTSPSTNGHQISLYEKRITRHLARHAEESAR